MVPFNSQDQQDGEGLEEKGTNTARRGNRIYEHGVDRQNRFISILADLAEIKGYNKQREIRRRDGSFIERSDIRALLANVVSRGKEIHGQEEFVELLREAKVDPDLITNLNIKSKLTGYRDKSPIRKSSPPRDTAPKLYRETSPIRTPSPPPPIEQLKEQAVFEDITHKTKESPPLDGPPNIDGPFPIKRKAPESPFEPKRGRFEQTGNGWESADSDEYSD